MYLPSFVMAGGVCDMYVVKDEHITWRASGCPSLLRSVYILFIFSWQSVCRVVAQFLKAVWSFISLKARLSRGYLHLFKENRQINESCCLLAPTQPTSTTEYITPPAVYIQHLGNHTGSRPAGHDAGPPKSHLQQVQIDTGLGCHQRVSDLWQLDIRISENLILGDLISKCN